MNKSVDERLVPNGEYVDAMNVRLGSTEDTEIGSVENSKGNSRLTDIEYNAVKLSNEAKCIGAFEDGARETIYWFVTDSNFSGSTNTSKLDLILSLNILTNVLTYHVISIDDGGGVNTTLNFNPTYLITGVNMVDDFLFFTDDYNAPRRININKNYADPSPIGTGTDQFLGEDVLVIKAPPPMAPMWEYPNVPAPNAENFLQDSFICFAYRYKYEDGEYSATSQFSDVAFSPEPFGIDTTSFLNQGMVNKYNQVEVSFNTGGPLVKDVELLFKDASNSVIKVIEKFNKLENSWNDNVDVTYMFNNSKIYTILPSSEILRLYDNVPRFAKAQTIMGNRLMYGNYIDGYDLTVANGNPITLNYSTDLSTETITTTIVENSAINTIPVNYSLLTPYSSDAGFTMDLNGLPLTEGSIFSFVVRITHDSFEVSPSTIIPPTATTGTTDIDFTFTLQRDYTSVHDMVTSQEFIDSIGTPANVIFPTSGGNPCDGYTFTDNMNCLLPGALGSYTFFGTGISAIDEVVEATSSIGSTLLTVKLLASLFKNGTDNLFEYYKIVFVDGFFQNTSSNKSLHSDRDYEVGIVYMDEYGRASTALVSTFNTVHVPCGNSILKNQIKVTIPTDMIAPSWAKRYKFVVKQDLETYNTIFSQFFIPDQGTNGAWFLLEGENAAKVQKGDRLKVKVDTNGALGKCVWTTVLEKEAQQKDFYYDSSSGNGTPSPAGVYMKLNPKNFSAVYNQDSAIDFGLVENWDVFSSPSTGGYPNYRYPMNRYNSVTSLWEDVEVPVGSTVKIYIEWDRQGKGNCDGIGYVFDKEFTSSATYDNLYDWWIGENINITTGQCTTSQCNINTFDSTSPGASGAGTGFLTLANVDGVNKYIFQRSTTTNELALYVRGGTQRCSGSNDRKMSYLRKMQVEVFQRGGVYVFETEPQDTSPDVFYEGPKSYFIDANGFHLTTNPNEPLNVDQDATTQGVAYLEFFNCFSFGNGVESYKIEDSMIGDEFTLGNRTTAVSAQDYKEADRFADITYSGVYNDESNVNKLNEFNLGLANFLPLEDSYGEIQILSARATDILTLQEDKISYVTVGKNILTDAVGGGTVTSVPEVLGQQVARQDAYGISNNPESFVVYGYNKFFTDSKRGAVLQLKGSAGSNEQLSVISEVGLRSWFRNLFIDYPNTQKLGGFDPYMNEYVLSSNETLLPSVESCIACGISQTLEVALGKPYTFCINLGTEVGTTSIGYNITEGVADISVSYNSVTTATGNVSGGGSLSYNKNLPSITTASITVTANAGAATVEISANCPAVPQLTVIQVCVTANNEAYQSIHNEYNYTDGSYTSPTQSNNIIFATGTTNPLISNYASATGGQGDSNTPTDGSTVRLISNKIGSNSFVFDPTGPDKFRYLRSNNLYANNPASVQSLIAASAQALPLVSSFAPSQYYAEFTMPATGAYLYLIWDYRNSVEHGLCFDASTPVDVCCDCTHHWYLMRNTANASEEYPTQSPVALVVGTYYSLNGEAGKCFEVISTTTVLPTRHINTTCTP